MCISSINAVSYFGVAFEEATMGLSQSADNVIANRVPNSVNQPANMDASNDLLSNLFSDSTILPYLPFKDARNLKKMGVDEEHMIQQYSIILRDSDTLKSLEESKSKILGKLEVLKEQSQSSVTKKNMIQEYSKILEDIDANILKETKLLVSRYLNFEDAINLIGKAHSLNENQIIQLYSNSETEKVLKYIFRNLDDAQISVQVRLANLDTFLSSNSQQSIRNLEEEIGNVIRNGKLDLLKSVLESPKLHSFSLRQLRTKDIAVAAERGNQDMVKWILDILTSGDTLFADDFHQAALYGSINGEKLDIFKMMMDDINYYDEYPVYQYSNLGYNPFLLRDLANKNLQPFLDYYIPKLSGTKFNIQSLLESFVRKSTLPSGNPDKASPEMVDYILHRPEWTANYMPIQDLLYIMSTAQKDTLYRLGMEFSNSKLNFLVKVNGKTYKLQHNAESIKGPSPLEAAIWNAKQDPELRNVLQVLKNIKKTEIKQR